MSNILNNSIILSVKLKLKSFLLSLVKYYDGQLYDIKVDANKNLVFTPSKSTSSVTFLVVARHYYQESVENYPIDSDKELKKVLSLKYADKIHSKYKVCSKENGQTKVNVWRFDPKLPPALFTLPETIIYSQQIVNNQQLTITAPEKSDLYIARFNNVVYSSVQSSVVKNSAIFTMSAGISPEKEDIIDRVMLPGLITFPFKKLPLLNLFDFIKPVADLFSKKQAKWLAIPIVAVFCLHLLLTSAYIQYMEHNLQSSMAQYNDQFSTMLDAQQEMETNYQRFDVLNQFFQTQKTHTPFLIAMSDVFPKIGINNIRMDKERYIVRGYTKNALDLLTFMNNHKAIEDAKFDFPVRKGGTLEFVVISFQSVNIEEELNVTEGNSTLNMSEDKEVVNG